MSYSIDDKRYWDGLKAEEAALQRVADAAKAPRPAKQRTEDWTREETMAHRVAWNAKVQSGDLNHARGMIDPWKVGRYEREIGFTANELRAAVKRHGL